MRNTPAAPQPGRSNQGDGLDDDERLAAPLRASGSARRPVPQLLALTGVSFALLTASANHPWLGADGGIALATARLPVGEMLEIWARDTHPPLYYLVLHYWTDLTGTSAFVAKLPGVAAAVLAISLAYQWGRRVRPEALGLVTAFLIALSAAHVARGTAVRDYALGMALTFASLYTFTSWLSRPTWRHWALYVGSSLAALYSFYFAVPVLLSQGLYLAFSRIRRRRLGPWLGAVAAMGIGYVPWLWWAAPPAWEKLRGGGAPWAGAAQAFPLDPERGYLLLALRWLTSTESLGLSPWQAGSLLALIGIMAWGGRQRVALAHGGLLLLGLGVTLAFAFVAARFWLEFEGSVERFVYTAMPFFAPLAAFCLLAIGRRFRRRPWSRPDLFAPRGVRADLPMAICLATATLPLLPHLGATLGPHPPPPHGAIREYLEAHVSPHDLLLFTSPLLAGEFAAGGTGSPWSWRLIPTVDFRSPVIDSPERAVVALLEQPGVHRALWLVLWDDDARNLPVAETLTARAYPAGSDWVGTTYVASFLWPRPLPSQAVGARFAGAVELVEAAYDQLAPPGGAIRVLLTWQAGRPISDDYRVFVHLVGQTAEGEGGRGKGEGDPSTPRRWAQHDGCPGCGQRPTSDWPRGELILDRHGLLLPPDIPAGQYWLEVGLAGGGRRLALEGGGNAARLGPVQVRAAAAPP